jgi:hypothetical protein
MEILNWVVGSPDRKLGRPVTDQVTSEPASSGVLVFPLLSVALLAVLFATNIYRAGTQSITIDEAFTYDQFVVDPPYPGAVNFAPYNYNLYTVLAKLSVRVFGLSEFTFRLPSVLGGLLYFFALLRLCQLLFGASAWMLLAVAINSLNPFVLDYLSAARGYGLALGFWTLGAYYATRWIIDGRTGSDSMWLMIKTGIALGLALASHITEAFAVAALEAVLVGILFVDRLVARDGRAAARFPIRFGLPLCLITLAVAAPILWQPLHYFSKETIDGGAKRYREGIESLLTVSLMYRPTELTSWDTTNLVTDAFWILSLVLFAGLAIATIRIVRHWVKEKSFDALPRLDRLLLLFSATALLTFLLLRIEPKVLHHPYYASRRLLFTLPLVLTACTLWLRWLSGGRVPQRAFAFAGASLVTLTALNFALEFNVKSYKGWEFNAAARQVVDILRERYASDPKRGIRVGLNWLLADSVSFYRSMYKLDWMEPVTRESPECYFDYYVVLEGDMGRLQRFTPKQLFHDAYSGVVVAEIGTDVRKRLSALREMGVQQPSCSADVTLTAAALEMGHPEAPKHLLRDCMGTADKSPLIWTFEKPALLFHVSKGANTRFKMEFLVPPETFKKSGPFTMTVRLNGKPIGRQAIDVPEAHTFEAAIPMNILRDDGLALVETTLDKYYIAETDGQILGYLLGNAGFVTRRSISEFRAGPQPGSRWSTPTGRPTRFTFTR